jgi:tetratricopeptide (TPR) repeat protein
MTERPPPPAAPTATAPTRGNSLAAAKVRSRAAEVATVEAATDTPLLRLAIAKSGLGLELGAPWKVGPVTVTEATTALDQVKFPVDVTGGLARFRHKRGRLVRLTVEATAHDLSRWLAPKLRGLLAATTPEVVVQFDGPLLHFAIANTPDLWGHGERAKVLAFSIAFGPVATTTTTTTAPEGTTVAFAIHDARGIGLTEPAPVLAARVAEGVFGPLADRRGGLYRLSAVAQVVARDLFPKGGARTPDVAALTPSRFTTDGGVATLRLADHGTPPAAELVCVPIFEECTYLAGVDDALLAGDRDGARTEALRLLAGAPGHAGVITRLCAIDAFAGGRAEVALALLDERAAGLRGRLLGALEGDVALEAGHRTRAQAAYVLAAETEPLAPLAGALFEAAADCADEPWGRLPLLDQALAWAPQATSARWARIDARLATGQVEDALADVHFLELAAATDRERYRVARHAGDRWNHYGFVAEAAKLHERALRWVPDEPFALAGLGYALFRAGRVARAVALFEKAIELGEKEGLDLSHSRVHWAEALAEKLGDAPAAVSKVAYVPRHAEAAPEARSLEAKYRAACGDLAGASLAYARLAHVARERRHVGSAVGLMQGARMELALRGDAAAAMRLAREAQALTPEATDIAQFLAEVSAQLPNLRATIIAAATREQTHFSTDVPVEAVIPPAPPSAPPSVPTPASVPVLSEAEAEGRIEELTARLRLDPADDRIADELARLLRERGRGLELLALLSARLEDAPEDRREALLPRQRELLTSLEEDARAAGNEGEAELFALARSAL